MQTTDSIITALLADGFQRINGAANPVSDADMRAALADIEDGDNWKRPLSGMLGADQLVAAAAAAAHFCGSELYIKQILGTPMFQVWGPGYYVRVGA